MVSVMEEDRMAQAEEARLFRAAPALQAWFRENRRPLPFREGRDPYRIYVSEIMLQQTRIETVLPYFERFTAAFPTLAALAEADDEKLFKLWEGLGYYSRVRNMKRTALICVERFGGSLPDTYEDLIRLPGIGSYTAGAILSLAFGQPVPVADGNVLRVISRILASERDVSEPSVKKEAERLLAGVLRKTDVPPEIFNEGLMELGEQVCLPKGDIHCGRCPVKDFCLAAEQGRASEFPVRSAKKPRRIVEKTVFLLYCGGKLGLIRRKDPGVLRGLYGLPEEEGILSGEETLAHLKAKGFSVEKVEALPEKKHIFTHLEWHMAAFSAVLAEGPALFGDEELVFASEEEVEEAVALPSAYRKWTLFS